MTRPTFKETNEARQRLLNRLGYFKDSPLPRDEVNKGGQFSPLERRCSTASLDSIGRTLLRSAVPFQQELHDDTTTSKVESLSPRSARVQFNHVVSGVEIPSRHQYSSRIKRTMWADRAEISAMVERNSIEFESEGFDWENVVLDQDMYVNEVSGELVHPCHYDVKGHHDIDDDDQDGAGDHYFPPLRRHNSVS